MAAEELRARDERQDQPLRRWLAVDGDEAVAAVSIWDRPDHRTFLYFAGSDRTAHESLTDAVVSALGRPVHAFADAADTELVAALQAAGFETEHVAERFRLPFDRVLARLRRAWIPSEVSIFPADAVDEDRLFELDNTVRRLTLGTDGWEGNGIGSTRS